MATQLKMSRNLAIFLIDFFLKFEKIIEFATLNKDKIVNKILFENPKLVHII